MLPAPGEQQTGPGVSTILRDPPRLAPLACKGYKCETAPSLSAMTPKCVIPREAVSTASWTARPELHPLSTDGSGGVRAPDAGGSCVYVLRV